MPKGKKLVGEFSEAGTSQGPAYFRAHYLHWSGEGVSPLKWGSTNAYTEGAAGKPIYDWTILDNVFDTYMQPGPAVQRDRPAAAPAQWNGRRI
jgi:xylan 1,4-beta-xylosidase